MGTHPFYCRINLTINQGIKDTVYFNRRKFGGANNAGFIDSLRYDNKSFENSQHNYIIYYTLKKYGAAATYSNFTVPITNSDTLTANLNL